MNHRELIRQLTPLHGAGEARAIVRLLMEERFSLSQTDLLLGRDESLSASARQDFEQLANRLLQGEPVQHVLGFADFCGHRFHVSPHVLIPRPETEELVQWAISTLNPALRGTPNLEVPHPSSHSLLDLCTGSGCIAVLLALALPEAAVTAVDISAEALDVAQQNARDLGASNVRFLQADILDKMQLIIDQVLCSNADAHFSILVSNPPYVRDSEAAGMTPTVLEHEPHLALFVPDEDPLRFYRAIALIGRQVLAPGGSLFVELNAALAEETRRLFLEHDYSNVCLRADQFSRPRMLRAVCPGPSDTH